MKVPFHSIALFLALTLTGVYSQNNPQQEVMTLEEFLGMVKAYHPYVRQAKIQLSESEAELLYARGVFDPKISIASKSKTFTGTAYYDKFNATFKIPTYFGVDFVGSYDQNKGTYLNPEQYLSDGALYGVGVDLDLGRGFWANERLNILKKAKVYNQQVREKTRLEVNKVLNQAANNYMYWYEAYAIAKIRKEFVENARFRLNAVKAAFARGDVAAIDTTEARIALNTRILSFEQAKIKLRQSALKVSNYLWYDESPLELTEITMPEENLETLKAHFLVFDNDLSKHPLLRKSALDIAAGQLDRRVKRANLLPEMTLGYRWLSQNQSFDQLQWALDPNNNTTQLKIKMPLFLRKERGALKLSNLKLQEANLMLEQNTLELRNKVSGLKYVISSMSEQAEMAKKIVDDYAILYQAEQTKLNQGESSLFVVNTRESKYIESLLKQLKTNVTLILAQAELYFNLNFVVDA